MLIIFQITLLAIQLSEFLIPNTISRSYLVPNFISQIILSVICAIGFGAQENGIFGAVVYSAVGIIVTYRLIKEINKNEDN